MQRYYFDHNATTPVAPEVLDAMLPYLQGVHGNASSIHSFGQEARLGVENARRQVASLLGCAPKDIVFTSGGTEADNLAVFGTVRAIHERGRHVITSQIEHPAVINACEQLEREGAAITYLPVASDGLVAVDDVRAALRPETVLISIMHANNELGTIQPLADISKIAVEAGVRFHTDGVQSCGKVATRVKELGVDFFSLSGHKFYGPKGAGALYVRKGLQLEKVQYGGHHERDRRPGTENVPGIVGLGAAAELAQNNLEADAKRIAALRDRLESEVLATIEQCRVNAAVALRVPNTSSIQFDHVEGEALLIALDLRGCAVSSGAACSSGAVEPSHVLIAAGLSRNQAKSTLRFSLGRQTTPEHIDALVKALTEVVAHLRALSPAYSKSET